MGWVSMVTLPTEEKMYCLDFPTDPFTILELHDQDIGEFYVVQEGRMTDFEASKLRKGRSGCG